MKECLWCKKEFQEKKTTAKYCSTSCRVMWCNKNKKQKAKVREDVLMNMISEMNKKLLMQIENVAFPPIVSYKGAKGVVPAVLENNNYKPKKSKGIVADVLGNEKYKFNPKDINNKFPESNKPQRNDFKDGFEYSIALAEWKEKQYKSNKTK